MPYPIPGRTHHPLGVQDHFMLRPNPLSCRITLDVISFMHDSGVPCKDTQALFEGTRLKRFRAIASVAERKLAQLDAARTLSFLRAPPGNRVEALKKDRFGQHSIRINDQWRVCFVWTESGPTDVEIVDYH